MAAGPQQRRHTEPGLQTGSPAAHPFDLRLYATRSQVGHISGTFIAASIVSPNVNQALTMFLLASCGPGCGVVALMAALYVAHRASPPAWNALSRASRARPLASGTRCPYRSTVVVIDLWPSQRETSEMGTPSASAVLANVCRRSWLCRRRHNHD